MSWWKSPPAPPPPSPFPPPSSILPSFDASALDDGGAFALRASLTVYGSGADVGGLAPSWSDASWRCVTDFARAGADGFVSAWAQLDVYGALAMTSSFDLSARTWNVLRFRVRASNADVELFWDHATTTTTTTTAANASSEWTGPLLLSGIVDADADADASAWHSVTVPLDPAFFDPSATEGPPATSWNRLAFRDVSGAGGELALRDVFLESYARAINPRDISAPPAPSAPSAPPPPLPTKGDGPGAAGDAGNVDTAVGGAGDANGAVARWFMVSTVALVALVALVIIVWRACWRGGGDGGGSARAASPRDERRSVARRRRAGGGGGGGGGWKRHSVADAPAPASSLDEEAGGAVDDDATAMRRARPCPLPPRGPSFRSMGSLMGSGSGDVASRSSADSEAIPAIPPPPPPPPPPPSRADDRSSGQSEQQQQHVGGYERSRNVSIVSVMSTTGSDFGGAASGHRQKDVVLLTAAQLTNALSNLNDDSDSDSDSESGSDSESIGSSSINIVGSLDGPSFETLSIEAYDADVSLRPPALGQVRSIQKFFTHRPVSTLDRSPFQLTGELFLYGMALRARPGPSTARATAAAAAKD